MDEELSQSLIGVSWNFSQYIRDNVLEAMSGVKGENSIKIIGPDLKELERKADLVAATLNTVPGVVDAGVFRIMGQSNLNFPIDKEKCARWNVSVGSVEDALATAVGGKALTEIVEGERSFDLALRWPERLRSDRQSILDIPVDVGTNIVESSPNPTLGPTLLTGAAVGPAPIGSEVTMPSLTGSTRDAAFNNLSRTPRRRLGDLVTPLNADGELDPAHGSFVQPGASTIYREEGHRLIAIKFGVHGRDLGSTVAAAQQATSRLIQPPTASSGRASSSRWSGPRNG